jgi:hypothetical protein
MLVNKSSKKLHEDIKINSNNSTVKGENFLKIEIKLFENYAMKKLYLFLHLMLTSSCKSDILVVEESHDF